MIKRYALLLLLGLCAWGWQAAASPHPSRVVEAVSLARVFEPELRPAETDCAYTWCCQCSPSVSADPAALERREPSPEAAPMACVDVQRRVFVPVADVAAVFAAQATAPGPNRALYLLHLNLRR